MKSDLGASLTKASFPKSSPSCSVQTTPCIGNHTTLLRHLYLLTSKFKRTILRLDYSNYNLHDAMLISLLRS